MNPETPCPLCAGVNVKYRHRDRNRSYWQCGRCRLIFVAPSERINAENEKKRYDLHRNDPDDEGYRSFLNRLVEPLVERVPVGARGLDFGCGPSPVLAQMMNDSGRPTTVYDLFYAPDAGVWSQKYDFITASEVVEHLRHPGDEFTRLFQVLKPGGWLAIMTSMVHDEAKFVQSYYIRDRTHIAFFSPATFEYLASLNEARLTILTGEVILFQRDQTTSSNENR